MDEMKIQVGKLKNIKLATEKLEVSSTPDTKKFGYEEIVLLKPIVFKGEVENLGDILHLRGIASGSLQLVCSRCLEAYAWDFELDLDEEYTNKAELCDADEDEELNFYLGDAIDIAPQLLKKIFMEIPMKLLCSEACKGLCPQCGINLNKGVCSCDQTVVDLRLEKLKDLLKN